MSISIIIADDHASIRRELRMILEKQVEMEILGVATCGREAIALTERLTPDVLVIDISMSDISGLEVIHQICKKKIKTNCLVYSLCHDKQYIDLALQKGALGYVCKDAKIDDLIAGIRRVAHGQLFIPDNHD